MSKRASGRRVAATHAEPPILEGIDASLLDIVDHVLTKGVVVTGDLLIGVADVDLVYLRLSAVLCAADRIFSGSRDNASAATRRRRRVPGAPGGRGR